MSTLRRAQGRQFCLFSEADFGLPTFIPLSDLGYEPKSRPRRLMSGVAPKRTLSGSSVKAVLAGLYFGSCFPKLPARPFSESNTDQQVTETARLAETIVCLAGKVETVQHSSLVPVHPGNVG